MLVIVVSFFLQHYFTVSFNHDNQKTLELRTEDAKDCDEWVAAITHARYRLLKSQDHLAARCRAAVSESKQECCSVNGKRWFGEGAQIVTTPCCLNKLQLVDLGLALARGRWCHWELRECGSFMGAEMCVCRRPSFKPYCPGGARILRA